MTMDFSKFHDHREILFAQYYVEMNFNAVQAALKAGYSKQTSLIASKYVNPNDAKFKQHVAAYIDEIVKRRARLLGVTQEWVLERYLEIAEVNVTDFLKVTNKHIRDENGKIKHTFINIKLKKDFDKLTRAQQQTIKKIKDGKQGFEIEFHDSKAALDQIAKFLKMDDAENFVLNGMRVGDSGGSPIDENDSPAAAQQKYLDNVRSI